MNIEQAIDILKNSIADYVIGEYCEKCADNKICDDRNEDCYYQQAIDTVITAYEKEKEKNKELEVINAMQKYRIEVIDERELICKEKIKEKIEELDEVLKGQLIEKIRVYFEAQKEVLQSLLEEE